MNKEKFNLGKGLQLKEAGQTQTVANESTDWLIKARSIAVSIAQMKKTVTITDVRRGMGANLPHHPNVWGSVFKSKEFISTGKWVPNTNTTAHARRIQVWRLRSKGGRPRNP